MERSLAVGIIAILLVVSILPLADTQMAANKLWGEERVEKVSSSSSHIIPSSNKEWTFMFYYDKDFEGGYDPLHDFAREAYSHDNLNIIVLQDTENGPAKMWYIDEHHHMNLLQEMGEINMGDYTTLSNFIKYGKENFPANRYIIDFFNHGGGWMGTCWDETNDNDYLSMNEIQMALEETGGVDIIMFGVPCLMGTIEAVYEIKELADVYIGSEEIGYWYTDADIAKPLCDLLNENPFISNIELGEKIIQFVGKLGGDIRTMSAIRTDKIDDLKNALDTLSGDLFKSWFKLYKKVYSAHEETFRFGWGYADPELYDIYDFVQKLSSISGLPLQIQQDLQNVKETFNQTVIAEHHGWREVGAHGLSIYFPSKFMNSLSLLYGAKFYELDFASDTFWNEFIGLFVLTTVIIHG